MSTKATVKHPNSRIVTIFRSGSLSERAQTPEVQSYLAQSKDGVGSYFASASSKEIGSGLTWDEKKLLMPELIDLVADDKDFRKKVTEYFQEINTDVPFATGTQLEIGLKEDNTKPVSEKNMPLDVEGFVRWRHALHHPHVAASKDKAQGNRIKRFYIFDKAELQLKNTKKTAEMDAAMGYYLQIKETPEKVKMMLTLLGEDIRTYNDAPSDKIPGLMKERLRELAQSKAADFIRHYEQEDLETRYWIRAMEETRVLKKVGSKYLDGETNALLANSEEEMLFFFKDEDQSDVVTALKARQQEKMLQPVEADKKRTHV